MSWVPCSVPSFGVTPSQERGPKPSWATSWSPQASPWNTRFAGSERMLGSFAGLRAHGPGCSLSNDGTHSCRNTGRGDEGVTSAYEMGEVPVSHSRFFSPLLN